MVERIAVMVIKTLDSKEEPPTFRDFQLLQFKPLSMLMAHTR
jgi:hypothetical protein